MTLRDLTPDQVTLFQKDCERRLAEKQNLRREGNKISEVDYKLAYSDGLKAVLALISFLP